MSTKTLLKFAVSSMALILLVALNGCASKSREIPVKSGVEGAMLGTPETSAKQ